MSPAQLRLLARIAELERSVDNITVGPEHEKLIDQLTDAECVDLSRRLCQVPLGAQQQYVGDEVEDAAIVRAWRELTR
jgi:hypothetical protein